MSNPERTRICFGLSSICFDLILYYFRFFHPKKGLEATLLYDTGGEYDKVFQFAFFYRVLLFQLLFIITQSFFIRRIEYLYYITYILFLGFYFLEQRRVFNESRSVLSAVSSIFHLSGSLRCPGFRHSSIIGLPDRLLIYRRGTPD
jgi:hypothetical protein